MEIFLLIGALALLVSLIAPWIALAKAVSARRVAEDALSRVHRLEADRASARVKSGASAGAAAVESLVPVREPAPSVVNVPPCVPAGPTGKPPPLVPSEPRPAPPPLPPAVSASKPSEPKSFPVAPEAPFNWERFMGVKLFNWAGGFTLFIGLAFLLKYSIEHSLVSPTLRATGGFLTGVGLIVAGLRMDRARYGVMVHTLCATGIVTLYAVIFACHGLWNFEWFKSAGAFVALAGVTVAAFTLAIRLDARVVAVLGVVGGFLTPLIVSSGHEGAAELFGYITALNVGILSIARNRRWHSLALMGAFGTGVLSIFWMVRSYGHFGYDRVPGVSVPMAAMLLQLALYTAASHLDARRRGDASPYFGFAALGVATVCGVFGLNFIFGGSGGTAGDLISNTPSLAFGYLLVVIAGVTWLATTSMSVAWAGGAAGCFGFSTVALWMGLKLKEDNLPVGLGIVVAFAFVQTALPLLLRRIGKVTSPPFWAQVVSPMSILVALIPVLKFDAMPVCLWGGWFLLAFLAVAVALFTREVVPVIVACVFTMLGFGMGLSGFHEAGAGLNVALGVFLAFAAAFMCAGVALVRRASDSGKTVHGVEFPALAAILPFALLMMVAARIPLSDPSVLFAVMLALGVSGLVLADRLRVNALAPVGLVCAMIVQLVWQARSLDAACAGVALPWHLAVACSYFVYPFLRHNRLKDEAPLWVAAAFSPVAHFGLVYRAAMPVWPTEYPGYLPVVFFLVSLAGVALVRRAEPEESPGRLMRLALFGGVALLFLTMIFPIQFKNEWLTVSWALEGAALVFLHRKVPHRGLIVASLALLTAVFVRLALNEAVLSYHSRGEWPVFNVYLYTYGVAIACLGVTSVKLPASHAVLGGVPVRAVLGGAAAILAFILLNLEIADFFTAPGSPVTVLTFGNDLTRDMTYSIAWGLFALAMLVAGVLRRERVIRLAAIGLFVATLGKLFLHDLSELDQLYRIGAFMGVAGVLLLSSFLYQKFRIGESA